MAGSAIEGYLEDLFGELARLEDGAVADYIPELAKADPTWFGIALATSDGRVYSVGDADHAFTIQSLSKPFMYGAALDIHGVDHVLAAWESSPPATPSTPSPSTSTPDARSTRW